MRKWKTTQEKKCTTTEQLHFMLPWIQGCNDVNVHEKVTARHKSHLILVKKITQLHLIIVQSYPRCSSLVYVVIILVVTIFYCCLLWSPIWATLDGLFLGLDLMKKGVHLMELPTDAKRRRASCCFVNGFKVFLFSHFSPSNWSSAALSCEQGAPFKTSKAHMSFSFWLYVVLCCPWSFTLIYASNEEVCDLVVPLQRRAEHHWPERNEVVLLVSDAVFALVVA